MKVRGWKEPQRPCAPPTSFDTQGQGQVEHLTQNHMESSAEKCGWAEDKFAGSRGF